MLGTKAYLLGYFKQNYKVGEFWPHLKSSGLKTNKSVKTAAVGHVFDACHQNLQIQITPQISTLILYESIQTRILVYL